MEITNRHSARHSFSLPSVAGVALGVVWLGGSVALGVTRPWLTVKLLGSGLVLGAVLGLARGLIARHRERPTRSLWQHLDQLNDWGPLPRTAAKVAATAALIPGSTLVLADHLAGKSAEMVGVLAEENWKTGKFLVKEYPALPILIPAALAAGWLFFSSASLITKAARVLIPVATLGAVGYYRTTREQDPINMGENWETATKTEQWRRAVCGIGGLTLWIGSALLPSWLSLVTTPLSYLAPVFLLHGIFPSISRRTYRLFQNGTEEVRDWWSSRKS